MPRMSKTVFMNISKHCIPKCYFCLNSAMSVNDNLQNNKENTDSHLKDESDDVHTSELACCDNIFSINYQENVPNDDVDIVTNRVEPSIRNESEAREEAGSSAKSQCSIIATNLPTLSTCSSIDAASEVEDKSRSSFNLKHKSTEENVQFGLNIDEMLFSASGYKDTVNKHETNIPVPLHNNYLRDGDTDSIQSHTFQSRPLDLEHTESTATLVADAQELDDAQSWSTTDTRTFVSGISSNLRKLRYRGINSFYEDTENTFACLPEELLILIFSYLSPRDISIHVAPVCKLWHQLSKEHSLWKVLDFSSARHPILPSLELLWVIRRAPLLRKLILSGRPEVTHAEIAIICESCPHLCDIDLGFCDNLSRVVIRSISELCTNLASINVEGCETVDHTCLKYLSKCAHLTHMNFSHCIAIGDTGISHLGKTMKKIVSLNLDGINLITDSAVKDIVHFHHEHLEELDLDGAEISDEGIRHVAMCSCLTHLAISFCDCLTDNALDSLKQCVSLKYLRLRKGSDFTRDGLCTFFMEASLNHLVVLNLSECSSTDDHVVLQIALSCGRHLWELSLSWCWDITDLGIISIVDHCCKLETLDLLGIDKILGDALERIPEDMPHLTFLDLTQCNQIQDSLICDVIRHKPDLKVRNYYGEEFVHD